MSLKQPGRSKAVNEAYDLLASVAGRPGPEGGQPGTRQGFWGLAPGADKEGGGSRRAREACPQAVLFSLGQDL